MDRINEYIYKEKKIENNIDKIKILIIITFN